MSVPATSGEPLAGETGTGESTLPRTVGRILPLTLLWLVAGTGLAAITTRVRDWYAMPNELLNEHRAISVAQTLSPLPVLHRQFVASFDQLYPLLIAPMFRDGDVLVDLRNAHALNAYVMTSACIPAYLLARRVTDSQLFAYLIAALSVLHAVDLLRDPPDGRGRRLPGVPVGAARVPARPGGAVAPTRRAGDRRDRARVPGTAAARRARNRPPDRRRRVRDRRFRPPRRAVRSRERSRSTGLPASSMPSGSSLPSASSHPAGSPARSASTARRSPATSFRTGSRSRSPGISPASRSASASCLWSPGSRGSLARFFRPPGRPEQHAFACLGATASVAVLVQVTVFDLRFIDGLVLDRYLIYLVPIVFLGFVCALRDSRSHMLALGLVTFVVAAGFAFGAIPTQALAGVNSDAPIQALYPPIVSAAGSLGGARILLAGGTIALVLIYLACRRLLRGTPSYSSFAIAPSRGHPVPVRGRLLVLLPPQGMVGAGGHEPERSELQLDRPEGRPHGRRHDRPLPHLLRLSGQRARLARLRVLEQVGRPRRPALTRSGLRVHQRDVPEAPPRLRPEDRRLDRLRRPLGGRGRPGDEGADLRHGRRPDTT